MLALFGLFFLLSFGTYETAAHLEEHDAFCASCHTEPETTFYQNTLAAEPVDRAAYVTRTAKQPAPLSSPIDDSNCLKCHQDITQTQDFNRYFHVFLAQWQQLDPNAGTCVDCHSAHTADGDPELGFLQENRAVQVCQSCHTFRG